MALGEPDPDPPLPSWSLFVPGEPKSTQTGSIIRANGRAFPRYRNTDWSNRIALAAAASRPPAIFEGALKATLTFTRTRPTSLKKSVDYPTTRPDLDNMSKKLLDALEGIVYRDDAQLVMLTKVKRFGDTPGVAIRIEALPPLASLQLVAALYGLPATAEAGS
jgi:Holliday junction resolvase RusA-like endonuclease